MSKRKFTTEIKEVYGELIDVKVFELTEKIPYQLIRASSKPPRVASRTKPDLTSARHTRAAKQ